MATHEHITDRTTLVLARYKALQYARAAYRSANRRPPPMRQLSRLSNDPFCSQHLALNSNP